MHSASAIFLLVLFILSFHLILAPFNKVEESFFMQATHDLLFLNWQQDLAAFDHFTFPGVVPRSFVGPLLLAGPGNIVGMLVEWLVKNVVLNNPTSNLDYMPIPLPEISSRLPYQFGARFTLSVYCAASLLWIAHGLRRSENRNAMIYFILLSVSQFHMMFWGSRTIANTFAVIPFQLALGFLLRSLPDVKSKQQPKKNDLNIDAMILCLTFCCVAFRAELFPLAAAMIFFAYYKNTQRYSLGRVIKIGVVSSVVSIIVTVGIDSYFWQRLVWPELEVFFFNGLDGKSVDWGVSPWYFYFTNLLPRIAPLSLTLIVCSFLWKVTLLIFGAPASSSDSTKKSPLVSPLVLIGLALLHISVLSLIPHKEWRFIIYTIPLLNIAAAFFICKIETHILARAVVHLSILGCFCASLFMLYISHHNYPGGVGLYRFHDLLLANPIPTRPHVHIDTYVAMTGASRFGQSPKCCIYSKNESFTRPEEYLGFDWLLTGNKDFHSEKNWKVVDVVTGYAGVSIVEPFGWIKQTIKLLQVGDFALIRLPVNVRFQDAVYILKRAL